jgi:hypothetical protein
MKLRKINLVILLILILSSYYVVVLTEPDWDNLVSFKMYAFNYTKPLSKLTDSEMDSLVSIEVPVSEARKMFKGRIQPTSDILIYKTMILCRLKFKGAPDRRFVISSYGHFFTDLYVHQLYEISPQYKDEWRKFVRHYERQLLDKNYLKHYPESDTTQWYRGDIEN